MDVFLYLHSISGDNDTSSKYCLSELLHLLSQDSHRELTEFIEIYQQFIISVSLSTQNVKYSLVSALDLRICCFSVSCSILNTFCF